MVQITLVDAIRRKELAEGSLRAAWGALAEQILMKTPYIPEAMAAVDEAQKRFAFNARRVEQIREDEVNMELARVRAAREAAKVVVEKPRKNMRGKRAIAVE